VSAHAPLLNTLANVVCAESTKETHTSKPHSVKATTTKASG
jgi:hypothetical protein